VLKRAVFYVGPFVLTSLGKQIEKRIAEKIYNDSRNGSLQISGFPQFDSLISAIKQGSNPRENRNYQVCTQQGDRLLVLQSYAAKFMDSDVTKDEATQAIEDHNKVFNQGGNFWEDDMRTWVYKTGSVCSFFSFGKSTMMDLTSVGPSSRGLPSQVHQSLLPSESRLNPRIWSLKPMFHP
jgi:hypothetical protein